MTEDILSQNIIEDILETSSKVLDEVEEKVVLEKDENKRTRIQIVTIYGEIIDV